MRCSLRAGLVFYFVVSGGGHIFGQNAKQRAENFEAFTHAKQLTGTMTQALNALRCDAAGHAAAHVISRMLAHRPEQRLTMEQVVQHPFFWSPDASVRYVGELWNTLDSAPGLRERIDEGGTATLRGDWRARLPAAFWAQSARGSFLKGDGSTNHYGPSVSDLVRLVRNLSQHFADQRPEVRRAISHPATGEEIRTAQQQQRAVGDFFFAPRRFPQLVVHLWRCRG